MSPCFDAPREREKGSRQSYRTNRLGWLGDAVVPLPQNAKRKSRLIVKAPSGEPRYAGMMDVFGAGELLGKVAAKVHARRGISDCIVILEISDWEVMQRIVYGRNLSIRSVPEGGSGYSEISADIIRFRGGSQTSWAGDAIRGEVILQCMDLRVRHGDRPSGKQRTSVDFWLTPNWCLDPQRAVHSDVFGKRDVQTSEKRSIPLGSGGALEFDILCEWDLDEPKRVVAQETLAARCECDIDYDDFAKIKSELLPIIDDCLLAASIATRVPVSCHGWTATGSGWVEFFRRDRVFPIENARVHLDWLIDPRYLDEFLALAHKTIYSNVQYRGSLTNCASFLSGWTDSPIELRFLHGFSVLEEFLEAFKASNDMERIFEASEWRVISKRLREDIREITSEESKRKQIFQKINELNRIPASHVFDVFCQRNQVQTKALWPVFDSPASLYKIRNRIVHGRPLSEEAIPLLLQAQQHLQWLLERIYLALLEWPLEKTDISVDRILYSPSRGDCTNSVVAMGKFIH